MKITAVRHGETEGNVKRIVQSHTGGLLTVRGREQAKDTSRQLAAERFDAIYTSDLRRCIETAELLLAGFPTPSFIRTEQLRERDQAAYDGKSWDDLPVAILENTDIAARVPGGESWLQVEARIAALLNDLYAQYPDGSVLLITHGGPVKTLRSLVDGLSLEEAVRDMISNAGIWRGEIASPVVPTAVS
ncbi:MAG TPA: histidine phosphatase family protein [Candidatus Saccharimonadales bacterium]|jgi:broad specificity phosphatase PhoE